MKKTLLAACLLCTVTAVPVNAGNTDAYYSGGKIILPQMVIGNKTYYVTLYIVDPATLTFRVDLAGLAEISAPAEAGESVNLHVDDILGTWDIDGEPGTYVTFSSDGTYIQVQAANQDEEACPNGGNESGSFTWETGTGLLQAKVASDANGSCGLSHPRDGVPLRVFIDGDKMQILEKGQAFSLEEEFAATRR